LDSQKKGGKSAATEKGGKPTARKSAATEKGGKPTARKSAATEKGGKPAAKKLGWGWKVFLHRKGLKMV
jgi:hypothetical protein